jgi:hypothetical protein
MSTNDPFWTDLVHADGTMLVKGQVGRLGDPANLDRVGDRTWRRARPGDHLGERLELGAEGVGKSVHEEIVRCATRKGDPWFGGPYRPPFFKTGGDAVV